MPRGEHINKLNAQNLALHNSGLKKSLWPAVLKVRCEAIERQNFLQNNKCCIDILSILILTIQQDCSILATRHRIRVLYYAIIFDYESELR